MIRAIIFDLGGVVFTNGTKKFSEHLAQKYEVDIEKAKALLDKSTIGNAYRTGKISREEFWNEVKKELSLTEHIDVLEQKWIDVYVLIEETRDIIHTLAKKYKVYFLSDNMKERVEAIDKKYNFISWFHGGTSSHEVGIRKPHPDIYTIALQKTGLSAKEVLFIDDKENNLTPAKDLGIQTLLFENSIKLQEDLKTLGINSFMQTSLVISTQKEDRVKKQLQQSILRKRKVIEIWMEKVELLKIELELIKNEYAVRIGYLFLKDNQLDLEIIQYKNLKRLMDEGMTYEEAKKAEEDTFYNEILKMQKEQERLEEEKSFFEKRQEIPKEVQENIKGVWKRLIRKFHPDLVVHPEEKKKREAFMKHINKAYTEGNYELLLELENNVEIENVEEAAVDKLEMVLVATDNLIATTKQAFKELRQSEWYVWKKRKERAKDQDVFTELEKKLLDDVVKKITIMRQLRQEVHPQNET